MTPGDHDGDDDLDGCELAFDDPATNIDDGELDALVILAGIDPTDPEAVARRLASLTTPGRRVRGGIADKLRSDPVLAPLVIETAGWRERGSDRFEPRGFVWHHTAGARSGVAPSLRICIEGRTGLSGPLCNVFLARDDKVYVVAAGRANHAGSGSWRGLEGNSSVYGLEIENVGTSAEPWSERQLDLAARIASALGTPTANMCMHKEWTSRKPDMHTVSGDAMRRRVDRLRSDPTISCASAAQGGQATTAAQTVGEHPLVTLRRMIDAAKQHILRRGSTGTYVTTLQLVLQNRGAGSLGADGTFGPRTDDVVRFFQATQELTVDGVVGAKTWRALDR